MPAPDTVLGSVTLSIPVLADGKRLAPGTYQVRLTEEVAKPGVGQSPNAERYVEFVRGGSVAARELATVIGPEGDPTANSRAPTGDRVRVERLRGGDYVRVRIDHGGRSYLIHMPPASISGPGGR
ncbi:MAG: hypothetical protein FJW27_15955 [Acidimicrobiia bacterium]|nr:hypothetical protein [Acidimicrobiia bacterium]